MMMMMMMMIIMVMTVMMTSVLTMLAVLLTYENFPINGKMNLICFVVFFFFIFNNIVDGIC